MMLINGSDERYKIDSFKVNGLRGVKDSLAYKVAEIERHFHGSGVWMETASVPSATHIADRVGDGGGAFQLDAGNDDWGSWVQILGLDDTPAKMPGALYFDPHEILIEATEHTATYFVQFGRGASGAAALAAGTYTEVVIGSDSNRFKGITNLQTGRAPAGSLLWARCKCPGQNTSTFDFYIGIHEYEG